MCVTSGQTESERIGRKKINVSILEQRNIAHRRKYLPECVGYGMILNISVQILGTGPRNTRPTSNVKRLAMKNIV